MDGWGSVEELARWAFAQASVVMANEAHDGLRRCARTREVGARMIRAAHEAGVRRLAMEALPWPADGSPGPIRAIPPHSGNGYLAQPDMRELITTALDLGWSLWAYEAVFEPGEDPAEPLTMEFINRREREQASNLCRLPAAAPGEPILVWCGNGHACRETFGDWVPMGWHFATMSGIRQFVIDQTVSVEFPGDGRMPGMRELVAALGDVLGAYGGSAGIRGEQAPPPLNECPGVDAVVISTENTLT